jgi:DNA-binding NtrC family response regulator
MSNKLNILVVDDDRRMAKTIVDILIVKGYAADFVYSGSEALEALENRSYNCILTDIKMPLMNGIEFYLKVKELYPDTPVLLMTAYTTNELVNQGIEHGAVGVVNKPLDINQLLFFFSALRKERTVVIIDDDPNFCETIGDILRNRSYSVIKISDIDHILNHIESDTQVILLDLKLNGISGLDIIPQLKETYPDNQIVIVTGYREEMAGAINKALELDAYACLYKPLEIDHLLKILSDIYNQSLKQQLGVR